MRTEYKEGELLTKDDIGLVFKTRDGNQIKILAFLNVHYIPIITIDNNNKDIRRYTENGKFKFEGVGLSDGAYEFDLISFVGPDFTEDKKLRKFEFEGWIGEDTSRPLHTANQCIHDKETHDETCHDPIDKQFGYDVTGILNRSLVNAHLFSEKDCKFKFKKWKIIMEELPNENS